MSRGSPTSGVVCSVPSWRLPTRTSGSLPAPEPPHGSGAENGRPGDRSRRRNVRASRRYPAARRGAVGTTTVGAAPPPDAKDTDMRPDNRRPDELRPITFQRDFTTMADGSILATFGDTKVLCTASVDEDVPRWMRGSGKGWVTAEYSMLPGSTPGRADRETRGPKGRTQEIQRLIGRSLRAVCDMTKLGERQVIVDCDVLQADGGTRTASICAGYLALHDALTRRVAAGLIAEHPLIEACAAISVGIVDGEARLDLPYIEDSNAETDMNVVMTEGGRFIEVQGTAETEAFTRAELDTLLALAEKGIGEIVAMQHALLAEPPAPR